LRESIETENQAQTVEHLGQPRWAQAAYLLRQAVAVHGSELSDVDHAGPGQVGFSLSQPHVSWHRGEPEFDVTAATIAV
jgi:hypothetical protein